MASLPSGTWFSTRTLAALAGLFVGARFTRGTNIPMMLALGAAGYVAGGMV